MAQLAENPLILTLIARLALVEGGASHNAHDQPLPRSRVELYGRVLDLLLTRGHSPELLRDQRPFTHSAPAVQALGWLALHGHAQDAVHLSFAEIEARINAAPAAISRVVGGDLSEWLERLTRRAGVLEANDTQSGYAFAHRTFREYLAACALHDDVVRNGGLAKCGINSELDRRLKEAVDKPALWAEVFALLTGLLATWRASEAEVLVRRMVEGGAAYKGLLYRVIADAEGLSEETVQGVLGLASGRGEWQRRAQLMKALPELVGDVGTSIKLLGRCVQDREHATGMDLFWAHHWLSEIAQGRHEPGTAEKERQEAREEAAWIFRRHRPSSRAKVLAEVERLWKPIPAGAFYLGSPLDEAGRFADEGPRHRIEMVGGFEMLAVPVTNAMYAAFDPDYGSSRGPLLNAWVHDSSDMEPVHGVTWYEAVSFALWLSDERFVVRLPSEVEWEYACRAGTNSAYWSGGEPHHLLAVGWVSRNSGGGVHPVARPPNPGFADHPWGLYDMHGNVWEWCVNAWTNSYLGLGWGRQYDPDKMPPMGDISALRVIRGGSWDSLEQAARSAYRGYRRPWERSVGRGFRLIRLRAR